MSFSYFAHSFMDASPSVKTHVGVVSSKHKTFGFIRSALPTDTFFHSSACGTILFEQLKVGDAVCFQLDDTQSTAKPGKRVASYVTRTAEQFALQRVSKTQHCGRVVKLPVASRPGSGILRYVIGPGKVQHLTFGPDDMQQQGVSAEQLKSGQPVLFLVLTDQRQQQLLESRQGPQPSPHARHAYQRATQVKPMGPAQVALLPPDVQQQLVVLDSIAAVFDG